MTLSRIALESAASAAKSWKMITLLFMANFLLAVIFAFGFRSDLQAGFGTSMLPERLLQGFDATVFGDLHRTSAHLLTPFWGQIFWLLVFSFLLNTLFGGGIIKGLHRGPSGFSLAEFFADSGTYLLRLLLLLFISAIALLVIGVIWFLVTGVVYSLLSGGATTETPYVTSFFIAAVVFLVPMVALVMIIDYTKVAIVLDDERSPLHAFWVATKFVFRNFFLATIWQWIMIIAALALIVLYWLVEGKLAMATGFGIFLVFLLQQASIGGRLWVKLTTVDGQIRLYESRNRDLHVESPGFVPPVPEPLPPVPTIGTKKTARRRSRAPRGARTKAAGKRKG